MKKKLKSFCENIKSRNENFDCLDLSLKIFNFSYDNTFIQEPSKHKSKSNLSKFRLEDFDDYADRIKDLIVTILEGSQTQIYIRGGIGVGKTRFFRFLQTDVVPKLELINTDKTEQIQPIFYFDGLSLSHQLDSYEFRSKFTDLFLTNLESFIRKNFFKYDEEIMNVWDDIIEIEKKIKNNLDTNFAFEKISIDLEKMHQSQKEAQVDSEKFDYRKGIREAINLNNDKRRLYFAGLLKYINNRFYKKFGIRLTIVIDNIDQEIPENQNEIKRIATILAEKSDCRVVVSIRYSTYSQNFKNTAVRIAVVKEYKGPSPTDILKLNLEHHLKFNNEVEHQLRNEDIKHISKFLNNDHNHVFENFFNSLCGHNIRRSYVLANRLLCNSIFHPSEMKNINDREASDHQPKRNVMRAILLGTNNTFKWEKGSPIENIYQVDTKSEGSSYFIKLRTLNMIKNKYSHSNSLLQFLIGFKYSKTLIANALNEMMLDPKKLIWNDDISEIQSYDQLEKNNSNFSITTTGSKYCSLLFKDITYFQEMMLDTFVEEDHFSEKYLFDFSKFEDRIELLYSFCGIVLREDIKEVTDFINGDFTKDTLHEITGSKYIFSYHILVNISEILKKVINSRIKVTVDKNRKEDLKIFRKKIIENFGYYLYLAKAFSDGENISGFLGEKNEANDFSSF